MIALGGFVGNQGQGEGVRRFQCHVGIAHIHLDAARFGDLLFIRPAVADQHRAEALAGG